MRAWPIPMLGLLAAALLAPAPAQPAPHLQESAATDVQIVDELSLARANPRGYAEVLRRLPASPQTREAIDFLERQPARGPLSLDLRLSAAAAGQTAQQGRLGQVSHIGADGSRPRDRMQAQGVQTSVYAELVSIGQRRATDVVVQLIIDPPGPAHPHRLDIFDPLLKVAGAACGPNAKYGVMCFVDLAAAPMSAGEPAVAAAPPSGSTAGHAVPDEVLVELAGGAAPEALAAQAHLELTDRFTSALTGETVALLHVPDQRTPAAAAQALAGQAGVVGAQPNFLFDLADAAPVQGPGQYAAARLRLAQAHQLARGDHVLVGVVDSQVDAAHPELKGAIAASYDAVGGAVRPDSHGTGVAALIVAHGRLTGSAPAARLVVARAFKQGGAAQGTSFTVLKGFDWVAAHGARVINMSFAGPRDAALRRELEAAARKGIILVAAAGNAGPSSPVLYPAGEPVVIAVGATDPADRPSAVSSRGPHVRLAAPGVDLFTAAAGGAYQVSSGTSLAAAEVSGVVALMIQRKPSLGPDEARRMLAAAAQPPAAGGLAVVDAYRATAAAAPAR